MTTRSPRPLALEEPARHNFWRRRTFHVILGRHQDENGQTNVQPGANMGQIDAHLCMVTGRVRSEGEYWMTMMETDLTIGIKITQR
jgi:hypothetical protein